MLVSIIVCTRNRAASLRATLLSLRAVRIPEGMAVETLIVDNGSTDTTPLVAREAAACAHDVHYYYEPAAGQARARNLGLAMSRGRVILFLDDDVRVDPLWLSTLCSPLMAREAEAVTGSVRIPAHLHKPWMTRFHLEALAIRDPTWALPHPTLIGANMGFSREVLERVPAFDTELGPGARGFYDDTLFSLQLEHAGFRVHFEPSAAVEHHFDPWRLDARSLIEAARNAGRSSAYVEHHWRHGRVRWVRVRRLRAALCLAFRRLLPMRTGEPSGGPSEMSLRWSWSVGFFDGYALEQARPRNYERHGLVRLE